MEKDKELFLEYVESILGQGLIFQKYVQGYINVQSDKIDKFIEDILNLDLSESSCLRKIEFVDKKRYEEIQEDFNYEKDNNVQPRIRQQEINIVFQLAFEQNEPIDKIEFFKILKEKDTMFENPKMMGSDLSTLYHTQKSKFLSSHFFL